MKLKTLTLFFAGYVVVAVATGCGREHSDTDRVAGGGNSETHFLEECSDRCAGGLECVCGVCTKPCDDANDCSALSPQAACVTACGGEPSAAMCDVPCNSSTDCGALGRASSCRAGRCRFGDSDGAAGAAGAPGAGTTNVGGLAGRGGDSGGVSGQGGAGAEAGSDEAGGGAGVTSRAGGSNGGTAVGGAAGNGGGLGTIEVTNATSFRRALFTTYCEKLFGCPLQEGDDPDLHRLVFGTPEACADIYTSASALLPADRDLDAKLQAGEIELRTQQLPSCLAAFADCTDPWVNSEDIPACRSIFRGTSPLGGACSRPEDCADDVLCVTTASCPGTCTARVPAMLGENCSGYCDQSQGDTVCRELFVGAPGTCELVTRFPAADAGDPCSVGNFGTEVRPCKPGLYCLHGETALAGWPMNLGTCRALSPIGAECGVDFPPCSGGDAHCVGGTCQPFQLAAQAGDSCDATTLCDLAAHLYCNADGVCEVKGDGTEGSPCRDDYYFALMGCEPGLVCNAPEPDPSVDPTAPIDPANPPQYWSTCGKPRPTGDTCLGPEDCQSGVCLADHTCSASYCCSANGTCDFR